MIPLSRILDPDKRLDWARHLLDKSPTAAHTDPPAIAALVCLVDLVAWLATHPLPDSASDSHCAALTPGNRTSGTHATSRGAGSSPGRPRPPTAVGTDDADRAATGLCAQRRTAAPEWDTWREYLAEVYARSPEDDDNNDDEQVSSDAPSPLLLPQDTLVHLRSAVARPAFDHDTRSCLLSGCAGSLLVFLSQHDPEQPSTDSHTDPDVCPTLDMLMTQARSSTFPAPLPSSTVSSIALSLAATRSAPRKERVDASRRTLATLLGHYVSPTAFAFGKVDEADEHVEYAASAADNALILNAIPSRPASSVVPVSDADADADEDEDDEDADTRSIAAGIRDAQASIVRKDDKLRWLLGDNFQPGVCPRGSGPAAAPANKSPAQVARARELSASSFASTNTAVTTGDATPPGKRHQRMTSTTSSTAPLLPVLGDSSSSSSTRPSFSPSRPSFLHRRVMSTGSERIEAPHALATAFAAPPSPSASPTAAEPLVGGGSTQPFTDLAPALPHVGGPAGGLAPLAPSSPRRTSLDSALGAHAHGHGHGHGALHCDSLSASQRRELVRRSKKLEGFFGAPFQESAAARVLVDRRGGGGGGGGGGGAVRGQGKGKGQEEVSPTNTAFPLEMAPPPAAAASSAAAALSSSAASSSRRASLAPLGPALGYSFGAPRPPTTTVSSRLDARRPSALSLSSSQGGGGGEGLTSARNGSLSHSLTSTATSLSLSPRSPSSSSHRPSLHRSSSSPSRGRRSSSFSSLAEPRHTYFSERVRAERASEAREERRRKLDKVRRVLGERVPLALVVPPPLGDVARDNAALAPPPPPPMGRRGAHGPAQAPAHGGVGGGLRDRLKRRGAGAAGALAQAPEPVAGGGDAGWRYVEPQWDGGAPAAGARAEGDEVRKGRVGVDALHKARKLENLFGDLPPPALFLQQASPGPTSPAFSGSSPSRPPFLATRQRRSYSDLSGLARSPFAPGATAGSWLPSASDCGSADAALNREPTRSTIDSYRESIASLRYVVERDPGALDEVVRVYSEAEAGSGSSPSATEDEAERDEDENEDEDEDEVALGMQRSASASSHRAVRQAQKLCLFFGTTHGEVWRLLLNDIEASVLDDPSLDEDERAEVLAGLDRLRQSAPPRV